MVERKITMREVTKIKEMLANKDNITHIARTLGVVRITIYRTIKKYSLKKKQGFFIKLKHIFTR